MLRTATAQTSSWPATAAIDALVADAAAAHGVEAAYHPADVSRPAEVRDLVAFAERRFGRAEDVAALVALPVRRGGGVR